VVSEALTNAIRHSQASSISVSVWRDGDRLQATIADDGVGGAAPVLGSGLIGLGDRVDALGGHLVLESQPGRGTTISIELPLTAPTTA
jgi:signal transduction histidine kinase